jgi:hypothetical protein
MPGAQQPGSARKPQQREQAARGEPLAGAKRERTVELREKRGAHRDPVDSLRAVHDEIRVTLGTVESFHAHCGPGAFAEPGSGRCIPWHAQMIVGAGRRHHRNPLAA